MTDIPDPTTTASKAPKSTPKDKAPKSAKKAPAKKAAKAPAKATPEKKPVLVSKSIKEILKYTGGDENLVIQVSGKCLVDIRTANDRAKAKAAL